MSAYELPFIVMDAMKSARHATRCYGWAGVDWVTGFACGRNGTVYEEGEVLTVLEILCRRGLVSRGGDETYRWVEKGKAVK